MAKIGAHISAYLTYIGAALDRAGNTTTSYATDLAQFADYLEEAGISDAESIDLDAIRGFLREVIGYGFAKASVARKLSAVRGFTKYLHERGVIPANIAGLVRSPKLGASAPRALSQADTVRLLDEGTNGSKHLLRDRLVLELLYGSGLRVGELTALDWGAIDIDERWVRVFGKGSKERIVPFGRGVKAMLVEWRGLAEAKFGAVREDTPLFPGVGGARLTDRTVQRIISAASERVGLVGVTPHSLRHSFATHMLDRGAPLRIVQELLGHESLVTTQRYLAVTTDELKASYIVAHPRAGGTNDLEDI